MVDAVSQEHSSYTLITRQDNISVELREEIIRVNDAVMSVGRTTVMSMQQFMLSNTIKTGFSTPLEVIGYRLCLLLTS